MKRLLAVLAGAAFAASIPLAAWAQDTKGVQGTVSAVGPNTVTVKVKDKDMVFNVDGKTDITAKGASTATRVAQAAGKAGPTLVEVIKVGNGVEVRYHEAGMHAASIRVLPGVPAGGGGPIAPSAKTSSGAVTAVSGNSLTIKASGGDVTFVIDPKTEVVGVGLGTKAAAMKAKGEKLVITDFVTNGDTVSVRFVAADGSNRASQVRVTRKAGAK